MNNETTITIKNEFEKMKLIRLNIKKTLNEIDIKINTLKTVYVELLNSNTIKMLRFILFIFHELC